MAAAGGPAHAETVERAAQARFARYVRRDMSDVLGRFHDMRPPAWLYEALSHEALRRTSAAEAAEAAGDVWTTLDEWLRAGEDLGLEREDPPARPSAVDWAALRAWAAAELRSYADTGRAAEATGLAMVLRRHAPLRFFNSEGVDFWTSVQRVLLLQRPPGPFPCWDWEEARHPLARDTPDGIALRQLPARERAPRTARMLLLLAGRALDAAADVPEHEVARVDPRADAEQQCLLGPLWPKAVLVQMERALRRDPDLSPWALVDAYARAVERAG